MRSKLPPPVTKNRKRVALAFAAVVDIVQLALIPLFAQGVAAPVEDIVDIVTAMVLVFMLGARWRLAIAFALELVPWVTLFPTWTAVVLSLPTTEAPALPPSEAPHEAPPR